MYIWTTIRCGGVVAYSSYDSTPLLSGDRYFPVPVPLYIRGTSALIAKCSFQSLCLLSTWYSQIYYTLLQPRYSYTLSLSLRIIHNSDILLPRFLTSTRLVLASDLRGNQSYFLIRSIRNAENSRLDGRSGLRQSSAFPPQG
jgi:hypothetical protein